MVPRMSFCAIQAAKGPDLVVIKEQAPEEHISALQGSLHLGALVCDVPVAEDLDVDARALPFHPPGCLHSTHASVRWFSQERHHRSSRVKRPCH